MSTTRTEERQKRREARERHQRFLRMLSLRSFQFGLPGLLVLSMLLNPSKEDHYEFMLQRAGTSHESISGMNMFSEMIQGESMKSMMMREADKHLEYKNYWIYSIVRNKKYKYLVTKGYFGIVFYEEGY